MFWRHTINLEIQKCPDDGPKLKVLHHRWYLFGFIKVAETHQFVSVD